MLRFNEKRKRKIQSYSEFQYILCYGSTRLRFTETDAYSVFQYILCYGSTMQMYLSTMQGGDFNTSYVTVQRFQHQKHYSSDYISIHPMLRFNEKRTALVVREV